MIHQERTHCYHRMQSVIGLASLLLHLFIMLLLLHFYRISYDATKAPKTQAPVLLLPDEPPSSFIWASTNASEKTILTGSPTDSQEPGNTVSTMQPQQYIVPDTNEQSVDPITEQSIPVPEVHQSTSTVTVHNNNEIVDQKNNQKRAPEVDPVDFSTKPTVHAVQPDTTSYPKISPVKQQRTPLRVISQKSQQIMARIASTFLNEARDTQKHVITIVGDPHRIPTAQQIQRERYLARLQQCMYASCMSMRLHMPRISGTIANPVISIKVHRDGSVSEIIVERTSNNVALDQFYVAAFLDASRSFPPLPSYLPLSFYIFRWLIVESA